MQNHERIRLLVGVHSSLKLKSFMLNICFLNAGFWSFCAIQQFILLLQIKKLSLISLIKM